MTDTHPPTILIRMPNWLGDCVMAMPAVGHLRAAFPDARLLLAGRTQFRDFFSAQRGVAGFVPAPSSGFGKLIRSMSETRKIVKEANLFHDVDLGLLFTNSLSTAAWMWRTGSKRRVGYDLDCRRFFLTHPVECGKDESGWHFVRYYLWLAKCAEAALSGVEMKEAEHSDFAGETEYPVPSVDVSEWAKKNAAALLEADGIRGEYVVVAPASAYGAVKDWPPDHWRELVGMINNRLKLPVVVTGGADQRDVCARIAEGQAAAVDVSGRTDLDVFGGVLAGAGGFVGGDSGGAHLAGALGVPTVVIFGITNPVRTCPSGKAVRILGGNGGSGGMKLSSPEARNRAREVLAGILPETVFGKLTGARERVSS